MSIWLSSAHLIEEISANEPVHPAQSTKQANNGQCQSECFANKSIDASAVGRCWWTLPNWSSVGCLPFVCYSPLFPLHPSLFSVATLPLSCYQKFKKIMSKWCFGKIQPKRGYSGSVFVLNLNAIKFALWADSKNFFAPLQMTLTLPQFSSKHIQARVDPHMCTYIWLCWKSTFEIL